MQRFRELKTLEPGAEEHARSEAHPGAGAKKSCGKRSEVNFGATLLEVGR